MKCPKYIKEELVNDDTIQNYIPNSELDKTGIAMKSVQEDWKYDG